MLPEKKERIRKILEAHENSDDFLKVINFIKLAEILAAQKEN